MEQVDLKCLRCSSAMEKGGISNIDAPHPSHWSIHEPQVAALKGVTLLRGPEGKLIKDALERVKASRATVDAWRCPQCGYVELSAQQELA
jgi:DNA-directed RNA polymerase subunit RPC12/RpoP